MDRSRRFIVTVWLTTCLSFGSAQQNSGQGISLSVTPSSGKAVPGSDVTFNCTLNFGIIGNNTVIEWSRKTGELTNSIALGARKKDEFITVKRYMITTRGMVNQKISHILTISSVKFEDSGEFTCKVMGSKRQDSKTLAVCVDTNSRSCDCVQSKLGWSSPECFGESQSNNDIRASYNTTITGLGTCFAIAVIYGVIITVLFARDCMRIMYQKQKRKELRQQMMAAQGQRKDPYSESEKLTMDPNDDAASVPESGVWSEGSSNRNSDRQRSSYRPPGNHVGAQENPGAIIRERPRLNKGHAHINAAYNPDEVVDPPPRQTSSDLKSALAAMEAKPRPVVGEHQAAPGYLAEQPRADLGHIPHQAQLHVRRTEPPRSPYEYSNGSVPGAKPKQPTAPPSGTKSEGRGTAPVYPHDSRGAYTDATKDHASNHLDQKPHYTEPRRLEFVSQSQDVRPKHSPSYNKGGAYIDAHDTEI